MLHSCFLFVCLYFPSDVPCCSYVEIRDRSKDIIITGGENVSSVEVEAALMSHPAGIPLTPRNVTSTGTPVEVYPCTVIFHLLYWPRYLLLLLPLVLLAAFGVFHFLLGIAIGVGSGGGGGGCQARHEVGRDSLCLH